MRITHPCRSFVPLLPSSSSSSLSTKLRLLRSRVKLSSAAAALSLNKKFPVLTAMAGGGEAVVMDNVSFVDVVKFGFGRSEMYKETLAGTVDPYDRHVFLCYKSPENWAPRVEASDTEVLPKLLSAAVKAHKDEITVKTKVTVCGGGDGEFGDGDVLIFPEMIRYRGLKESDVDSFVVDVLVNGKPWAAGRQEVITGSHIFVCAHGSRDKRCGVCGPVLMENLNKEISARGLKDQVFVSPCSHIGGHKYAGNLIVYSPDPKGKVTGHWYGYVTPNDVPEILDQHIGKGEIIERLWRGQMGGYVEEPKKEKKPKLPNGKETVKVKKLQENEPQITESLTSCCQGANGVSCCSNGNVEQKPRSGEPGKTDQGKFSNWKGNWEQSDVLTSAAVLGVVASILVAYSIYRRSC